MNREMAEIIRNQTPVTLPPSATVQEACRHMHAHRIGAVLVTSPKGDLLGIFTGRDAVRVLAEGKSAGSTHLRQVMTEKPDCLPPGHKAIHALRLMRDGGFRHVPVVHEGARGRHRLAGRLPRARAGPAGRGNRDLGANALKRA